MIKNDTASLLDTVRDARGTIDDYVIVCDSTNNAEASIARGELIVNVEAPRDSRVGRVIQQLNTTDEVRRRIRADDRPLAAKLDEMQNEGLLQWRLDADGTHDVRVMAPPPILITVVIRKDGGVEYGEPRADP